MGAALLDHLVEQRAEHLGPTGGQVRHKVHYVTSRR